MCVRCSSVFGLPKQYSRFELSPILASKGYQTAPTVYKNPIFPWSFVDVMAPLITRQSIIQRRFKSHVQYNAADKEIWARQIRPGELSSNNYS